MTALVLLLALLMPMVLGLTLSDGPRAYYVCAALLVALLLFLLRHGKGLAWLYVCWLGVGVHLLVAGCGMWTVSGACDSGTGLPVSTAVLLAMAAACEVIATLEGRPWTPRPKKT